MSLGHLEFCCDDHNCKTAQQLGRVIWEYCKIVISFKKNALIQISLKVFAFDQQTIDQFRKMFVKAGSKADTIIVHPAISSSRNQTGDAFIDLFQIY